MNSIKEITVIGLPEFVQGFRLAGVERSIEVKKDTSCEETENLIEQAIKDDSIGIIIADKFVEEKISKEASRRFQKNSSIPFIVVSGDKSDESLSLMIREALGIESV